MPSDQNWYAELIQKDKTEEPGSRVKYEEEMHYESSWLM